MTGVRIRRGSVLLFWELARAIRPLWITLLLLMPAVAQAQLAFITNANNTITITGYTGSGGDLVIPVETNGYPVTSIGDFAFESLPSLTSVTIPNSVTSIGNSAFTSCGLTNITIPGSVTNIGAAAFAYCMRLAAFLVDTNNPKYSSVAGVLFDNSQTAIFAYPGGLSGSYIIPNSVTRIEDDAFGGCGGLTNVTIPDHVTNIGDFAFNGCYSLTKVTIPNSVTNIGDNAFHYCIHLTSVTIPNSVTSIGSFAISFCSDLTNVTIPNSVTSIGLYAFTGCDHLNKVYFLGNAPRVNGEVGSADSTVFSGESGTAYYVPGTTGWGSTFGGWPTALWYQPNPMILGSGYSLGVTTNQFGFTISWATNVAVVVEACTNLAQPVWSSVETNTLTDGSSYFSDPQWTNFPSRFYRVRSP